MIYSRASTFLARTHFAEDFFPLGTNGIVGDVARPTLFAPEKGSSARRLPCLSNEVRPRRAPFQDSDQLRVNKPDAVQARSSAGLLVHVSDKAGHGKQNAERSLGLFAHLCTK